MADIAYRVYSRLSHTAVKLILRSSSDSEVCHPGQRGSVLEPLLGICGEIGRPDLGMLTMAKLIYLAIASLDGYIADEHGKFDWAEPDDEVHRFVNQIIRLVGTHLYGRRMYSVMTAWETLPPDGLPLLSPRTRSGLA